MHSKKILFRRRQFWQTCRSASQLAVVVGSQLGVEVSLPPRVVLIVPILGIMREPVAQDLASFSGMAVVLATSSV